MPRISLTDLGSMGVISDRTPQLNDPRSWSSALNVHFDIRGIVRMRDDKAMFGTPSVQPKWAMGVPGSGAYYWLYSDHSKVYVYDGITHSDITKTGATYGGSEDSRWVGTLLGGIPVMTNGVDPPQYWPSLDPATKFADLANWPSGTTCRSIRAFGPYLLALNITKPTGSYPNMVKWSHPADPGSVPISWDETDPTKDAGEVELTDVAAGGLVDGVALGNVFVVYKENSTHILRHIGGRFVFDVDPLFSTVGAISTDCARQVPEVGGVLLATGDDLVIHGLQQGSIKSVIEGRVRRLLAGAIDDSNKKRAFLVIDELNKEAWFCYPESGQAYATMALVWNFKYDTVSFRDLESVAFAATGIISESVVETWDSDSQVWDADQSTWDEGQEGAQLQEVMLCLPVANELRKAYAGSGYRNAYVERLELPLKKGPVDIGGIKLVRRLWIRAQGNPFAVQVGAQEAEGGSIYWSSQETFTPGVDRYVDFLSPISGRFIAIRFESVGQGGWTIEGYDLEVESLGAF